jgi:hypothetical protein
MKQPKKPIGLSKPKAKADNTSVSKVVKQPGVGPNYSEMNKSGYDKTSKPNAKDTSDYKAGYRVGVSNARSGKLVSPDKKGNPSIAWFPFRGQGSSLISKQFGYPETIRYAEGRLEGEKRGKKK